MQIKMGRERLMRRKRQGCEGEIKRKRQCEDDE